jgi:CDP-diacylglycerol--serine O-phosphatidyltransferase
MQPPFAPYDPGKNPSRSHTRLRDIPLRMLVPNVLTLLAICSGLTAIRFAIEGRIELALGAIILAAILDGVDGRVARFLKSSSPFGAQMDSLADFVNFGVAPAMLLYFTLLDELRPLGWVAALIYAMCGCLRLARFNVQLDIPNKPAYQSDFFVGVPAPAGAMLVLLPLYLVQLGLEETIFIDILATIYVVFVGYLMVSNIPTYSGKSLGKKIPNTMALPMIILVVVLVAMLLSYPWQALSLAAIGYLVLIPLGVRYYTKLELAFAQDEMAASAEQENAETSDTALSTQSEDGEKPKPKGTKK